MGEDGVECPERCGGCRYSRVRLMDLKAPFLHDMLPRIAGDLAEGRAARLNEMMELKEGLTMVRPVVSRLEVTCGGAVKDVQFEQSEDEQVAEVPVQSTVVSRVCFELCFWLVCNTQSSVSKWKRSGKEEDGDHLVFSRCEIRRLQQKLHPEAGVEEVSRLIKGLSLRRASEEVVELERDRVSRGKESEPGWAAPGLSRSKPLALYTTDGWRWLCLDAEESPTPWAPGSEVDRSSQ